MGVFCLNDDVVLDSLRETEVIPLINKLLCKNNLTDELKLQLLDIIIFLTHKKLLLEKHNSRLSFKEISTIGSYSKECPEQILSFCGNCHVVSTDKFKKLINSIIAKIREIINLDYDNEENDKKRLYTRGKLGLIFCSDIDKLGFTDDTYFSILNRILEMENCTFDCLTSIRKLLENPIDNNPKHNEVILDFLISNCDKIVVPVVKNYKKSTSSHLEYNCFVFISMIIRTENFLLLGDEYINKVLHMSFIRGYSYFMYRLLKNEKLSIDRIKLLIDYYDLVLNNFYINDVFAAPEMVKRSKLPLFFVESCPNFNELSDADVKKMLEAITTTNYPFSMSILCFNLWQNNKEHFSCAKAFLDKPIQDAKFYLADDMYPYRYLPQFNNREDISYACQMSRNDLKDILSRIACLPLVTKQPLDIYKEILSTIDELCVSHIRHKNECKDSREWSQYHVKKYQAVVSHFRDVIDAIYDMLNLQDGKDNYVYANNISRCIYVIHHVKTYLDKFKIDDLIWERMVCAIKFAASLQSKYYDDKQFKEAFDAIYTSDDCEVRQKLFLSPKVPFFSTSDLSSLICFALTNDAVSVFAYAEELSKDGAYSELLKDVNPSVLTLLRVPLKD